jgi:predicted RNA-binding Zn-ribbon protein involved in translation (DUF1610 family)/chaperonin cofactor prefoldin
MNTEANTTRPTPKGPWIHRFAVRFLSILFGLLIYWLLGFIVRDIGTIDGPQYEPFRKEHVPQELDDRKEQLNNDIAEASKQIRDLTRKRDLLENSVRSLQQTINQLLELQRASVENDRPLDEQNSESLNTSLNSFLKNQEDYQQLNSQIVDLEGRSADLRDQLERVQKEIQQKEEPAQEAFYKARRKHSLLLAAYKLAALLPVLVLAGWLFVKTRGSGYFEPVLAFAAAVLIKVGFVMHDHFPERYFRYILVLSCLLIVVKILHYFIKSLASPKSPWLQKQYRDAYERFLCPVCEYPIRRGPMKFLYWNRRTVKKLNLPKTPVSEDADEDYTCPSCGTELYHSCNKCQHTRPTLLPFCNHCGNETEANERR